MCIRWRKTLQEKIQKGFFYDDDYYKTLVPIRKDYEIKETVCSPNTHPNALLTALLLRVERFIPPITNLNSQRNIFETEKVNIKIRLLKEKTHCKTIDQTHPPIALVEEILSSWNIGQLIDGIIGYILLQNKPIFVPTVQMMNLAVLTDFVPRYPCTVFDHKAEALMRNCMNILCPEEQAVLSALMRAFHIWIRIHIIYVLKYDQRTNVEQAYMEAVRSISKIFADYIITIKDSEQAKFNYRNGESFTFYNSIAPVKLDPKTRIISVYEAAKSHDETYVYRRDTLKCPIMSRIKFPSINDISEVRFRQSEISTQFGRNKNNKFESKINSDTTSNRLKKNSETENSEANANNGIGMDRRCSLRGMYTKQGILILLLTRIHREFWHEFSQATLTESPKLLDWTKTKC